MCHNRNYVKKVYATCPAEQKQKVEEQLRNFIKDLQNKNAIWSTDWDKMELPEWVFLKWIAGLSSGSVSFGALNDAHWSGLYDSREDVMGK